LDDALEYWKWLNNTTLVIVTKWSIYYWKADYIKPKKEFNRNESLAYTQIINYVASENLAWAAVIGTKIGEVMITNNKICP